MDRILKTTRVRVMEVASEGKKQKKALKKLFPKTFDKGTLVNVDNSFIKSVLEPRIAGNYKQKAIFLPQEYNWEIKIDSNKQLVLVPSIV